MLPRALGATGTALLLAAPAGAQPLPRGSLDSAVHHAMRAFEVPGLAIAAVRGGEPVLLRGYGVRRLGGEAPVDEHTRFGIGSNTKGMTAAVLATLVDEGRLGWDDRVVDHLPGFALADSAATDRLTVRDLLAHRSGLGLGAGDLLVLPASTHARDEVLRRLRYLPLRGGLRSGYRYNNMNYLVAGAVVEAATGRSWEENVRERIFAPLGMADVSTSGADYDPDGNWAAPHTPLPGGPRPHLPAVFDNGAAAGSINASAADLARWLAVLLDSGRAGDARLWSPARSAEMWTEHNAIRPGEPPPELPGWRSGTLGYGLGFLRREYRGHGLVYHSGEVPGYYSHLYLVPDRRVGVAVLTNTESPASHAVAMSVLDSLLGAEPSDWTAGMEAVVARAEAAAARAEAEQAAARDSLREASLPPQRLAGRYADAWYGEAEVLVEGRGLVIRFAHTPALVGDLDPWGGDTFRVRWRDPIVPDALATFEVVAGAVRRITMRRLSPRAHFRYDFQDLDLRPVR